MNLTLKLLEVRTLQCRARVKQHYDQVAYYQGQIDLLKELLSK